jgi:hypothetical protein
LIAHLTQLDPEGLERQLFAMARQQPGAPRPHPLEVTARPVTVPQSTRKVAPTPSSVVQRQQELVVQGRRGETTGGRVSVDNPAGRGMRVSVRCSSPIVNVHGCDRPWSAGESRTVRITIDLTGGTVEGSDHWVDFVAQGCWLTRVWLVVEVLP